MRRGSTALVSAVVLLGLAACTPGRGGPRGAPSASGSAPDVSFTAPARVQCPAATVRVSDAAGLTQALAAAEPGAVIELADGTYDGNFVATTQASGEQPVFLCGSGKAVLDSGGIKAGYVLHLDHAAYWRVVGLTIRNGQKGVVADDAQHLVLQDLTVEQIGDEAVHLRAGSSDNVVRDSTVRDTGRRRAKFGEGVYVGTTTSNWCTYSDCQPDHSDRNLVLDNTISATTAESVDVKEGTSDGVVSGNTFDGSALSGADSWVDVKGNGWLVVANTGTSSPVDGFQTHEIEKGWGQDNTFAGNSGSGLAQDSDDGVLIGLHPDRDTVVGCDNTVTDDSAPVTDIKACAG